MQTMLTVVWAQAALRQGGHTLLWLGAEELMTSGCLTACLLGRFCFLPWDLLGLRSVLKRMVSSIQWPLLLVK